MESNNYQNYNPNIKIAESNSRTEINQTEIVGNCLDDFEILRMLGRGGFGCVFKVKSKKNNKLYALKMLNIKNELEQKKNKREVILLKYFNHENICKCYSAFTTRDEIPCMVMEQYNNQDLYEYVNAHIKMNEYVKEKNAFHIFFQVLEGISYLHNMGIIHCDIKLGNIFMTEEGKIVIGDFGESMVKDTKILQTITQKRDEQEILAYRREYRGTLDFSAPEAKIENYCDEKTDVYSIGTTFFTLLYQKFPTNETKIDFELNYPYSMNLKKLILRMIEPDKNKRIDLSTAKKEFYRIYYQRYLKNSGIHSVTQCLLSYKNLVEILTSNRRQSDNLDNKEGKGEKKKICISLILNSIYLKDNIEENNLILKKYFSSQLKINLRENNDISPLKIVFCLINALNNDLNKNKKNYDEGNTQNRKNLNRKKELKNNTNIPSLYNEFNKSYQELFKSIITDKCLGVLKVTWTCLNCNTKYISFERFFSITFNINRIQDENINILDLFNKYNQNSFEIGLKKFVTCEKCKKYTKHSVNKKFYTIPNNLIIMFDRTKNKNSKIELKREIIFNNSIVENLSGNNSHALLGIIYENDNPNENSQYIPLINLNNKWYQNKYGQKPIEINLNNIYETISKRIIALFYYIKNVRESLFDDDDDDNEKNESNQVNNENNDEDDEYDPKNIRTDVVFNPNLLKSVNKNNNLNNNINNNKRDNNNNENNSKINQQNNQNNSSNIINNQNNNNCYPNISMNPNGSMINNVNNSCYQQNNPNFSQKNNQNMNMNNNVNNQMSQINNIFGNNNINNPNNSNQQFFNNSCIMFNNVNNQMSQINGNGNNNLNFSVNMNQQYNNNCNNNQNFMNQVNNQNKCINVSVNPNMNVQNSFMPNNSNFIPNLRNSLPLNNVVNQNQNGINMQNFPAVNNGNNPFFNNNMNVNGFMWMNNNQFRPNMINNNNLNSLNNHTMINQNPGFVQRSPINMNNNQIPLMNSGHNNFNGLNVMTCINPNNLANPFGNNGMNNMLNNNLNKKK